MPDENKVALLHDAGLELLNAREEPQTSTSVFPRQHEAIPGSHNWHVTAAFRTLGSMAKRLLAGSSRWRHDNKRGATKRFPPTGSQTAFDVDVCIVTTCSFAGGNASSTIDEVKSFSAAGLRVLIVHLPITRSKKISGRYLHLADKLVHFEDVKIVRSRVLIVRGPRVILSEKFKWLASRIETDRSAFVINNSAYSPDGEPIFKWDDIKVLIGLLPWSRKDIYPLGPAIRQEALADGFAGLSEGDWSPTFDAEALPFRPRASLVEPFVIGRHGRDGAEKWLEDPALLRAAYPSNERFQVHVLGGADKASAILGKLPGDWTVHSFGSLAVPDFLAKLDAFVYFPHSNLNEAFGRTVMEAIFSGLPCILPPRFSETFGDFAFYCQPTDVPHLIERLAADSERRLNFVTTVRQEALKRFESRSLFQRVPELLGGEQGERPRDLDPSLVSYKKWVETGHEFG